MQNIAGTLQVDPHKISTVCSGDVLTESKEKPGAADTATGSNDFRQKLPEYYCIAESLAMAFPILCEHWGGLV